jgi:hypothetical protein
MTGIDIDIWYNKEYVVQILEHEENLLSVFDEILVYVQRWDRRTWSLGERLEVAVKLDMPLNEIGDTFLC